MIRASRHHEPDRQLPDSIVTLSAKRKFTLPQALRRQYGLRSGDPVAVSITGRAITLTPMRIAAVRFDLAYQRFSVRCTNRDGRHELGVAGNLLPRRVTRLTGDARWVEQAGHHPDAWFAIDELGTT